MEAIELYKEETEKLIAYQENCKAQKKKVIITNKTGLK